MRVEDSAFSGTGEIQKLWSLSTVNKFCTADQVAYFISEVQNYSKGE